MRMSSGGDLRTWDQWVRFGREAQRAAERIEVNERPKKIVTCGNVVGGSLDGASIPDGTRDGQTLRWNSNTERWIG